MALRTEYRASVLPRSEDKRRLPRSPVFDDSQRVYALRLLDIVGSELRNVDVAGLQRS